MENNKVNNSIVKIKQPYRITISRYKLNANEKRILFRILEKLQVDITKRITDLKNKSAETTPNNRITDRVLKIPTKLLLPEGSQNYSRIEPALKSLRKTDISIRSYDEKEGFYNVDTGFIAGSRYYENNRFVEIDVGKDMLMNYLNVNNGFTTYALSVAFNLSSAHSMRIYEILSHWANNPKKPIYDIKINFDQIKKELGLDNTASYKLSSLFKKKVLEPVAKELKDKADIWFEIGRPFKTGKKIIGWQIFIKKHDIAKKPAIEKKSKRGKKYIEELDAKIYALQAERAREVEKDIAEERFENLVGFFKLTEKQAEKLLKIEQERDKNDVAKKLNDVRKFIQSGGVSNPGGYTVETLKKDLDIDLG